jgi:hypothetical protein
MRPDFKASVATATRLIVGFTNEHSADLAPGTAELDGQLARMGGER